MHTYSFKMDEEEYFDDPVAYIISLAALFGVYLILILAIYVWRWVRPQLAARDRQGNNNCTQGNDTSSDARYNDIFFIEPNSQEAARIREQLEKDDKDLPTYDEVMRISNLPTPTPLPLMPTALTMGASTSSINTSNTVLSLPPYRETGANMRPLTPPPYTPEPIGTSVVVPISTNQPHSQQTTTQST